MKSILAVLFLFALAASAVFSSISVEPEDNPESMEFSGTLSDNQ